MWSKESNCLKREKHRIYAKDKEKIKILSIS